MAIELRHVGEDEYLPFARRMERAFLEERPDAELEHHRQLIDLERSREAYLDDRPAGQVTLARWTVRTPGGTWLPTQIVAGVTVSATHRRRGVMREMLRYAVLDAHDRGEPVSALHASESPLYGRFGFGAAVPYVRFTLATKRIAFRDRVGFDGVEWVTPQDARRLFPPIHDALDRGGMIGREDALWDTILLHDPDHARDGMSALHHAWLPERGYVTFRVAEGTWPDEVPDGRVQITELIALDPDAESALWEFVCGIDLIETVTTDKRPLDDPLPHLVTDPLRVRPAPVGPMYLRLVAAPVLFATRRYEVDGGVTLRLHDELVPSNDGTWRLTAEAGAGELAPAGDADPEVELAITELAELCLGGTSAVTLRDARRLLEHRAGAAADLTRLLAPERAPRNATGF